MSFADLPYELLVRICRFNAHELYIPDLDPQEPVRDIVAASQVCRHWRSIVLSAPELWRFSIDPFHPCASWRDLLLKRSEPFSIEFKDAYYATEERRSLHDIQLQMQSGMPLRLRRYGVRLQENCSSAWPSEPGSWPQLRHLSLHFDTKGDTELEDDSSSRPPDNLPDHFPGLATPVLEHLRLISCYMTDWTELWTIKQTLTHLDVHRPRFRLCPDQWIDIVQNLPNLESLELVLALETLCDHPITLDRSTLGVQKFVLEDFLHTSESFLDRIELSSKCRQSRIRCHICPIFESVLEISEEDGVKAVSSHLKRFCSQIVTDNSRLAFFGSSIFIDSGPLEPAYLSSKFHEPVIADYTNSFSIDFDEHDEDRTHHRSFLFPALLDIVRSQSSSVDIIETEYSAPLSEEDLDAFLQLIVQCRNLRFMCSVNLALWEKLREILMSTATRVTNDATAALLPKLRMIGFNCRVQIGGRSTTWCDRISFDDLKVFCKHRAILGVPLESVRVLHSGVFEMDNAGEIKSEPLPWE